MNRSDLDQLVSPQGVRAPSVVGVRRNRTSSIPSLHCHHGRTQRAFWKKREEMLIAALCEMGADHRRGYGQ